MTRVRQPVTRARQSRARRWTQAVAAGWALLATVPASAETEPMTVIIVSSAGEELECHALAARWYGFDLGFVTAAVPLELHLGLDRATATASLPNALREAVPIAQIYCGRTGDAWRSRAFVPLRRLIDAKLREGRAVLICRWHATLACYSVPDGP